MKTVKDYLMELPPDVRELAINNTDKGILESPHKDCKSALSSAFIWAHSREGYDFWADVYKNHFRISLAEHFQKDKAS